MFFAKFAFGYIRLAVQAWNFFYGDLFGHFAVRRAQYKSTAYPIPRAISTAAMGMIASPHISTITSPRIQRHSRAGIS